MALSIACLTSFAKPFVTSKDVDQQSTCIRGFSSVEYPVNEYILSPLTRRYVIAGKAAAVPGGRMTGYIRAPVIAVIPVEVLKCR